MDEAAIQLRIRVVVVTTRAAVRSLGNDTAQAGQAIRRGLVLIDGIEADVANNGIEPVRPALAQARAELAGLLAD